MPRRKADPGGVGVGERPKVSRKRSVTPMEKKFLELIPECNGDLRLAAERAGYKHPDRALGRFRRHGNAVRRLLEQTMRAYGLGPTWIAEKLLEAGEAEKVEFLDPKGIGERVADHRTRLLAVKQAADLMDVGRGDTRGQQPSVTINVTSVSAFREDIQKALRREPLDVTPRLEGGES